MNDTPDALISRYLAIRDHLDAQSKSFQEWAKPWRDEMEAIAGKVHEHLLSLGGDKPKLATGAGTAFLTTTKNPKVENRDAYLDWVMENWDTGGNAMLQLAAPQVTAVNEYQEAHDGALPPGVMIKPNTSVMIRKT